MGGEEGGEVGVVRKKRDCVWMEPVQARKVGGGWGRWWRKEWGERIATVCG